jgi:hypothetical protein
MLLCGVRKTPPFPTAARTSARSAPSGALLCRGNLHYNPLVRSLFRCVNCAVLLPAIFLLSVPLSRAQQAPSPAGARTLLVPRKLVTGERATLAVLDVNGRLTPGVSVAFSDGEKVTTDVTGRALFVAPLNPGTLYAGIEGRSGHATSIILTSAEIPSAPQAVTAAPRVASLTDRFELTGQGFCGDADANHVTITGLPGLVLASSPGSLAVLPPAEMEPGPAQVMVSCGPKSAEPFTIVFVTLELEASRAALAPAEHRTLLVRVRGSTAKINLEARNLSPDVAELVGGGTMKALSSGGAENVARFELVGRKRGNFAISIRLIAPLSRPRL